jgi:hypothetical protein
MRRRALTSSFETSRIVASLGRDVGRGGIWNEVIVEFGAFEVGGGAVAAGGGGGRESSMEAP